VGGRLRVRPDVAQHLGRAGLARLGDAAMGELPTKEGAAWS
jgi:hypothetical protein